MKHKLLKKIRARFEWSKSNQTETWHLIDNYTHKIWFFDDAFVDKHSTNAKGEQEEPPCGRDVFKFRMLKAELLKPFYISSINQIMFRGLRANIRNRNRKRNKILNNE